MSKPTWQDLIGSDELFDSHCHITISPLNSNKSEHMNAAKQAGVNFIIDIAIDTKTSQSIIENCQNEAMLLPTAGIDPEVLVSGSELYLGELSNDEFNQWLKKEIDKLQELLQQNVVTMIGECGMDSFYLYKQLRAEQIDRETFDKLLQRQEILLRKQCELAQQFKLPLSIHSRNIEGKCLEIINEYAVTAVFHSFTGSYKVAKKIIESGHYLGVNGIITYDSAKDLRETYSKILGEIPESASPQWFYDKHVVFETDAPWLFPFDSSKQNEPKEIKTIFEFVQKLGR